MKSKQDIINEIDDDIGRLEYRKELIENLEIKNVSIEEWGELCRTPLRYDDLLVDIAKETFPQGYDFKRDCNYIEFSINDISMKLPTHDSKLLIIDLDWLKDYHRQPLIKNRYGDMRKYFELIDSGKYTWYDLAMCGCHQRNKLSKFNLFLWYVFNGRWSKIDRDKWEYEFKLEDDYNKKSIENLNEAYRETQYKLNGLKEILPNLIEFTDVVGMYNYKRYKNDELLNLEIKKDDYNV